VDAVIFSARHLDSDRPVKVEGTSVSLGVGVCLRQAAGNTPRRRPEGRFG
jgi:hypothetical protein